MSSLALGAAFAAVQLVHQAHSKVKTSRARCARLVERCQLVVDRLERIAETKGGDAIITERIHELERAFEHTARTIAQVGQQGIIASLLQSESNALRIESCTDTLTELISLFNLEGMVDVRRWQFDLEAARVRDHRELLSLGRRIESENAVINRELTQQGATIAEVLRVIHSINAGLQNAHFSPAGIAMPLSLSLDTGIRPIATRMSIDSDDNKSWRRRDRPATVTTAPLPRPMRTTNVKGPDADLGTPKSTIRPPLPRDRDRPRRLSESLTKKCAKMVPLANVLSKLSSSRSPSISLPLHGAATRSASTTSDSFCGRLPVASRLKTVSNVVCDDEDDVRSSASSWYPLPAEPPPPYQLRVANPEPECGCSLEGEGGTADRDAGHRSAAATSSSRFTTASIEAVRAPDSPVPVFPSPKLSTDSVFGSIESLASVSSGRSPGPRCRTRRNSAASPARRVLRRRDTIKFARRVTMPSGLPSVEPPIIRPL